MIKRLRFLPPAFLFRTVGGEQALATELSWVQARSARSQAWRSGPALTWVPSHHYVPQNTAPGIEERVPLQPPAGSLLRSPLAGWVGANVSLGKTSNPSCSQRVNSKRITDPRSHPPPPTWHFERRAAKDNQVIFHGGRVVKFAEMHQSDRPQGGRATRPENEILLTDKIPSERNSFRVLHGGRGNKELCTNMGSVFGKVKAERSCPAECSCPPTPPTCPPGVSRVADACGCCKVCAAQFNQDCNDDWPCDHIKGLHCHLGAAGARALRGLCRAEAQGLPCEFNGRVYQHGEDFRPSCTHQCSCMSGVVGCMPFCPHLGPAPSCSRPRLVTAPGGCCEEWVCQDDNSIPEEEAGLAARSDPPDLPRSPPNHISPWLLPPPPQNHQQSSTQLSFKEVLALPRDEVLLGATVDTCFPQITDWTDCSTTCGMGVSSRMTNNNHGCRVVRETRLCEIRSCDAQPPPAGKRGRRCQRTVRPPDAVSLTFAGCSTAQRYRPRYCGACPTGRCCMPSLSRTVRMRFHCPDGETLSRDVMWIQRCRCQRKSCPVGPHPWGPSVSLHNDIHTFQV
ncbi:unnamed protein product [Merluccius merluccius]